MCNSSRTQRLLFQLKDIQELTHSIGYSGAIKSKKGQKSEEKNFIKNLNLNYFISMDKVNIFGIFSEYIGRQTMNKNVRKP